MEKKQIVERTSRRLSSLFDSVERNERGEKSGERVRSSAISNWASKSVDSALCPDEDASVLVVAYFSD